MKPPAEVEKTTPFWVPTTSASPPALVISTAARRVEALRAGRLPVTSVQVAPPSVVRKTDVTLTTNAVSPCCGWITRSVRAAVGSPGKVADCTSGAGAGPLRMKTLPPDPA